jgi:hypothetical protein
LGRESLADHDALERFERRRHVGLARALAKLEGENIDPIRTPFAQTTMTVEQAPLLISC